VATHCVICRLAADDGWRPIEEALSGVERLGRDTNGELVFQGTVLASMDGEPAFSLEIADRGAVLGMPRASQLLFRFPDDTTAEALAATAAWVLEHVPLWWGAAGWFFRAGKGAPSVIGRRLAALAKRHWGVQLLDETALQWDALHDRVGVRLAVHRFAGLTQVEPRRENTAAAGSGRSRSRSATRVAAVRPPPAESPAIARRRRS